MTAAVFVADNLQRLIGLDLSIKIFILVGKIDNVLQLNLLFLRVILAV